jgi:hypothetical protein
MQSMKLFENLIKLTVYYTLKIKKLHQFSLSFNDGLILIAFIIIKIFSYPI